MPTTTTVRPTMNTRCDMLMRVQKVFALSTAELSAVMCFSGKISSGNQPVLELHFAQFAVRFHHFVAYCGCHFYGNTGLLQRYHQFVHVLCFAGGERLDHGAFFALHVV